MAPSKTLKKEAILSSFKQRFAWFLHKTKALYRNKKKKEVDALDPFIPENSVIFDIGAHFGQYAKAFAELKNKSCLVYCFEPVDYTSAILHTVLQNKKNTKIFKNGFLDKKDRLNINIPVKKSGKIAPGLSHLGDELKRDYITQQIDVDTIDNFVRQEKINRLDFIKIDVEGVEFLVFKGGLNTLKKFKPTIFCEVDHRYMARVNLTTDVLFSFFKKLDYECYLMEHLAFKKTDGYTKAADYLFIAKEKEQQIASAINCPRQRAS